MKITRFNVEDHGGCDVVEATDGDYVRFDDHKAAIARLRTELAEKDKIIAKAWTALGGDEPLRDPIELVGLASVIATGMRRIEEADDALKALIDAQQAAIDGLQAALADVTRERDNLRDNARLAANRGARLTGIRKALAGAPPAETERCELTDGVAALKAERDRLAGEVERLTLDLSSARMSADAFFTKMQGLESVRDDDARTLTAALTRATEAERERDEARRETMTARSHVALVWTALGMADTDLDDSQCHVEVERVVRERDEARAEWVSRVHIIADIRSAMNAPLTVIDLSLAGIIRDDLRALADARATILNLTGSLHAAQSGADRYLAALHTARGNLDRVRAALGMDDDREDSECQGEAEKMVADLADARRQIAEYRDRYVDAIKAAGGGES